MTSPVENSAAKKPRWYMPTPGKFVALSLLSVVVLYLSDQYDWFAFNNQKGWTVLIAVTYVASGLALLGVWAAVAYLFGRKAQIGLATLLFTIGVVALPCAWLAREVQQAKQLSEAIERLEQAGGKVEFHCYQDGRVGPVPSYGTTPAWLRNVFGEEFFGEVWSVTFDGPARFSMLSEFAELRAVYTGDKTTVQDEDLAALAKLPQLETVSFSRSTITDAGLRHLGQISALKQVVITESNTTTSAVAEFGKEFDGLCLILPRVEWPIVDRLLELLWPRRSPRMPSFPGLIYLPGAAAPSGKAPESSKPIEDALSAN